MHDPHADYLSTRSFGALDGLRAVAIAAVVWHHCGRRPDSALLLHRGFLGVDLFFIISGFLIVTLLLRERDATGAISLRGFYARRALRIFPLYLAVLLLCTAVALTASSREAGRLREDLPWAFLYLTNWVETSSVLSITWSLAAEEQFYLSWPNVLAALRRGAVVALGAAVVVTGGIQLVHAHAVPLPLPPFLLQTSFFPILLGVALAHLLHDARGYALARRLVGGRHAPLAVAGLVVLALSYPAIDLSGAPRMAVHASLLLLVASCVVREDHAAMPLLRLAPVVRLGTLSYGVYLLHHFGRHAVAQVVGKEESLALFAGTLAVTGAAAEVSYRCFESRFLALKDRFGPRRAPTVSAAAPAARPGLVPRVTSCPAM